MSTARPGAVGIRRWWEFPSTRPTRNSCNFIKEVFLESQITIGLLSNVTASSVTIGSEARRAPKNVKEALQGEILTAGQTAAARDFVNQISGSTRMLAHGLLYVGKGNLNGSSSRRTRTSPIRGKATTSQTPPRWTTIRTA